MSARTRSAAALLAAPRLAFDARLWTLGLDDLHAWWVSAGRPAPTYTDDRTRLFLEFREGFAGTGVETYEGPPRDGVVLRNERMLRHRREYYGGEVPAELWEPPDPWPVLYEKTVRGRPSLRGKLLGRGGDPPTINRPSAYGVQSP